MISASRFRIGGDATVWRVTGVVTLSHNWWCGDSMLAIDSNVRSGVAVDSVARRRRALVRLRMVWTSCKIAFGQRWWGSVCPLFGVPALSGNMVVAMCMASPRILCRSVARESIESLSPSTGSMGSLVSEGMVGPCRLVRIALASAIASEVGECESIST